MNGKPKPQPQNAVQAKADALRDAKRERLHTFEPEAHPPLAENKRAILNRLILERLRTADREAIAGRAINKK